MVKKKIIQKYKKNKKKLKDKEKDNKTKTPNTSRSDWAKDWPAGVVLGIY